MNPDDLTDLLFAPLAQDQELSPTVVRCLEHLRRQDAPRTVARLAHDVGLSETVTRLAMKELVLRGLARSLESRRLYVATTPEDSTA